MFRAVLVGFLLLSPATAMAQSAVPTSTSSADVLRDYGLVGKGRVVPTGGFVIEEKFVDNKWVKEGRQPVRVEAPTSKPGVTSHIQATAIYRWSGSSWTFVTSTVGGSTLVGMPDPTAEELQATLATNEQLFPRQVGNWSKIIKVFTVALAEQPNTAWDSFKAVELDMLVSYATIEGQEIVTYIENRRARFMRDGDAGPFTKMMVVRDSAVPQKRTAITTEDAASALTIWEQAFVDTIVKKEIPTFRSLIDACKFAYDTLHSDLSDEDVKWTLFWMMTSEYLESQSKLVPNQFGWQFLEGALEKRADFKRMYPEQFQYVRTSGDYIYFARADGKANGQCRMFFVGPEEADTPAASGGGGAKGGGFLAALGKAVGVAPASSGGSAPAVSLKPRPVVVTHLELPVGTY
jgi:hypothetical protein